MKFHIEVDSKDIITNSQAALDMLTEVIEYMQEDEKTLGEILLEVARVYDGK